MSLKRYLVDIFYYNYEEIKNNIILKYNLKCFIKTNYTLNMYCDNMGLLQICIFFFPIICLLDDG